jgi:hypothetical protein
VYFTNPINTQNVEEISPDVEKFHMDDIDLFTKLLKSWQGYYSEVFITKPIDDKVLNILKKAGIKYKQE